MKASGRLRGWPTWIVVCYTLSGWAAGIWMLTLAAPGLNVLGVLLVAHTLTYSAYLIHDCVHHAVFRTTAANDRMGCDELGQRGVHRELSPPEEKAPAPSLGSLDVVTFDYERP